MRLIFFILIFATLPAWACSPPPGSNSIERNVERADSILLIHVIKAEEEVVEKQNYPSIRVTFKLIESIKGKSESIGSVYSDYNWCSTHLLPGYDYVLFSYKDQITKKVSMSSGTKLYAQDVKRYAEYLADIKKELKIKRSPTPIKNKQK